MKVKKSLLLLLCILMAGFSMVQCEKGRHAATADEDSDRPSWTGGNTAENPHSGGNKGNGKDNTQEYGDLYQLLRDEIGRPEMIEIEGNWYVQPVDSEGNALDLNSEGELINPELATEVEFGRLNIARSPQSVLDNALEEALTTLKAADEIVLDACGRLTAIKDGVPKTIDSPRENMAIYQYLMQHEPIETAFDHELAFLKNVKVPEEEGPITTLKIAASCIAAGSDKTGTLTIDEIIYINNIINCKGIHPLPNEHELDKQGNVREYYNFFTSDYFEGEDGINYVYDRGATYKKRYVLFKVWNGIYYGGAAPNNENIINLYDVMTDNVDILYDLPADYGFTNKNLPDITTLIKGFETAADDAVQVLNFIHEDSNIEECDPPQE